MTPPRTWPTTSAAARCRASSRWMNADARALGLEHTHYTTPIGLDTPGNYSSPDDLVRLADYMMRHWPFFQRTVALPSATLTSGRYVRQSSTPTTSSARSRGSMASRPVIPQRAGYVLVRREPVTGSRCSASVLGTTSEYERDTSALSPARLGFLGVSGGTPVRAGERSRDDRCLRGRAGAGRRRRGYRTVVARSTQRQGRRR